MNTHSYRVILDSPPPLLYTIAMRYSRGTQAARDNGYGTRAEFERARQSNAYKFAAHAYDAKHGLASGSSMKVTSKFARMYGQAFYKKGVKRADKDIPPSYLKRVRDASISSLRSTQSWEDY